MAKPDFTAPSMPANLATNATKMRSRKALIGGFVKRTTGPKSAQMASNINTINRSNARPAREQL